MASQAASASTTRASGPGLLGKRHDSLSFMLRTTTMLSSVIKWGLHTYDFFSKLFTMPDDIFSTLLSSTVHNDISSFVGSYFNFALLLNQPLFSLQACFVVTIIGLNKASLPAQHESLAIWVIDKHTLKMHKFTIERTPSDHDRNPAYYPVRFSTFCKFPDSETVVESIRYAINKMTSQAAESLFVAIKTETEAVALLPLTNVPYECSSTSSPSPHILISMIDTVTSSLIKAVALTCKGSSSISPQSLATDMISGCAPHKLLLEVVF